MRIQNQTIKKIRNKSRRIPFPVSSVLHLFAWKLLWKKRIVKPHCLLFKWNTPPLFSPFFLLTPTSLERGVAYDHRQTSDEVVDSPNAFQ